MVVSPLGPSWKMLKRDRIEVQRGGYLSLSPLLRCLVQVLHIHKLDIQDARQLIMVELFDDMLLLKLVLQPLKIYKVREYVGPEP